LPILVKLQWKIDKKYATRDGVLLTTVSEINHGKFNHWIMTFFMGLAFCVFDAVIIIIWIIFKFIIGFCTVFIQLKQISLLHYLNLNLNFFNKNTSIAFFSLNWLTYSTGKTPLRPFNSPLSHPFTVWAFLHKRITSPLQKLRRLFSIVLWSRIARTYSKS
jgi:hypothetical protein